MLKSIATIMGGIVLSLSQCMGKSPTNPLLSDWQGPYGGVPPFDKVELSHIKPAMEQAIAQHRREIETIANQAEPPTFANTLVAMERSGKAQDQVEAVYGVWKHNLSTPEFQKIDEEIAPMIAAFYDEVKHNRKLFARIEALYKAQDPKLSPEDRRLLWHHYTRFVLAGAQLDDASKARLSEISQKLAQLYSQFAHNVLADEEHDALVIERSEELAGLPQSLIDSAKAEAEHRGQKGKWVIANTRSAMEEFLTYSSRRELREKAFRIWSVRGDQNNGHNNNAIASEVLQLRAERARILGYPTYAHWHLADTMAKTPDAAMDLMMKVWKLAASRVKVEVADMQKLVAAEKEHFKIQPWDYRYYAEKVRKARYDVDLNAVKPYLQLDHVREAMFWAAGELYGLQFERINDVPVFHADVSVYKVTNKAHQFVGLWYFDPYARPGKQSGAWMTEYRLQHKLDQNPETVIVSNNSNFMRPQSGEPVLISWTDAVTMFHEFGHALHGLISNVTYPSLSGTATARDFVEFPSQINEKFLPTPQVMRFLTDQNGKSFPPEMMAKIEKAQTFNQGFATAEFLASAIVDMKLHLSRESKIDPVQFEKQTLAELGMPTEIIMRHRIPHFNHVFSSDGYAAGYYGYLWAQVLDHDAFEAFEEGQGPFDAKVAERFQNTILAVGGTIDPAEAFVNFRGRAPKVDALLRARGFANSH